MLVRFRRWVSSKMKIKLSNDIKIRIHLSLGVFVGIAFLLGIASTVCDTATILSLVPFAFIGWLLSNIPLMLSSAATCKTSLCIADPASKANSQPNESNPRNQ